MVIRVIAATFIARTWLGPSTPPVAAYPKRILRKRFFMGAIFPKKAEAFVSSIMSSAQLQRPDFDTVNWPLSIL